MFFTGLIITDPPRGQYFQQSQSQLQVIHYKTVSVPHKVTGCVKIKKIETLRFLCLNERKVSLVAICAVIYPCKGSAAK